jgi:hypothetical protein
MGDLHPHQLAAVALMQIAKQRFRFQSHRMRDKPSTRRKPRPDSIEHRDVEATADEDGIRLVQPGESFGRFARDYGDTVRQSKRRRIAPDIRGAILACLDRSRRSSA